jgi:hypothetical protein
MRHITLAAALMLATPAAALRAQSNPSPHQGDHVRVRVACRATPCDTVHIEGLISAFSADTLTLQDNGLNRTLYVGNLESLEIEVWRHHNRAGRGALIGLVSGVIGGVIVGATVSPPSCSNPQNGFFCGKGMRGVDELVGGVVGGLGGLVVGAVIGTAVSSSEAAWQRIPLPPDRHRPQNGLGAIRVGLSVAF